MITINLPNAFSLKFNNLQVDYKNPSNLGTDLSLVFYLPNGHSAFEEIRLWFDMIQWKEALMQIKSGNFNGVEIYDLSKKIVISFFSAGLAAKVKICINRSIPRTGYARADYETKIEVDNVNRFADFMFSLLEEHKLMT